MNEVNDQNTVPHTTHVRVYEQTRDALRKVAARAVLADQPEPTMADLIRQAVDHFFAEDKAPAGGPEAR